MVIEAVVFYISLIVLAFLVVRAIISDAERIALQDATRHRIALVQEAMSGLRTLISSLVGDAVYLSTIPEVQRLDPQETRRRLEMIYHSRSSLLASVTRLDSAGVVRVTVPYSAYEGTDITDQPHIKRLLRTHKPVIGGPVRTVQGFDAIIVHVPTFVDDSIFTGSVATLVSFDSLVARFFAPLFEKLGEGVWLADENGTVLVHSRYPFGRKIGEIYGDVTDTSLIHFLENFPPPGSGWLSYRSAAGGRRILCWYSSPVGFERWIIGSDFDAQTALSAIAPLKRKLLIALIVALVVALLGVFVTARQIAAKARAEQEVEYLKLINAHREKLDYIYRFAQGLIGCDSVDAILRRSTEAAAKVFGLPLVVGWQYNPSENALEPNAYVVDNPKLSDELSFANVSLPSLAVGVRFNGVDVRRVSAHMTIPIDRFTCENPSLVVLVHTLKALFEYTHVVVLPLRYEDMFFGCLMFPSDVDLGPQSELVETFRVAVSQALYIRHILNDLMTTNRIHKDILNTVDKAIFLVDANFTVLSASPEFYRIYDVSGNAVGKNLFDVAPFLRDLGREEIYREVIHTKRSIDTEETYIRRNGRRQFTKTKIIPIAQPGESVRRILTIVDDVTEFRLLEEQLKRTAEELSRRNRQLQRLAVTDELTKLRNYRYFTEQLPVYIARHRAEGKKLALLSMDLDRFKDYNDTYGHPAGDRLLMEVAEIIRGFLRSDDFAARYGGDEFVLVLSDTGAEEALDVAERLCRHISSTPFLDGSGARTEHISASIGVAVLEDDVPDAEELIRRADTALYVSKAQGRNRVTVYKVGIEQSAR